MALCRDTALRHGHDTAGHRQDTTERGATIRPRYATTRLAQRAACELPGRCACGLGAVGAQPGFRVCTQPNLVLGHCFESLLGTLFMSTVHEDLIFFFKNK